MGFFYHFHHWTEMGPTWVLKNLSNGYLMLDFDHNGLLYLHLVATRALINDWTGDFLLTTSFFIFGRIY